MTIDELEKYFETVELPLTIKLNTAITITNVPGFVKSHFEVLNNYRGNNSFYCFYKRLMLLKSILDENK